MSESELKRYYKMKAKKPEQYTYDDDGNLIEKNREGAVTKTIPLPTYRPPTMEEYDEMERKRMEKIALATKEFEDARKALREALNAPDVLDSDIVTLNRATSDADNKLQAIRFPLRDIEFLSGIDIKVLDFDKITEKRKYPFNVASLKTSPFTLQEQYVRIGKVAPKPLVSVAEARAAEDAAITVILFEDPDTNEFGFLSLNWVINIDFKGTKYHSAKQAISAELAKTFNDTANLDKIMAAETPDEINYTLENVPGEAAVNEAKWTTALNQLLYDINIIKFSYPELKLRLLETKSAQLGAYIPDDNLLGIGLSIDNIQSKNPINWTGQNLLGKVLMRIRDKFKEDIDKERLEATVATVAPKRKTRPKISTSVVSVGAPAPAPATASATATATATTTAVPVAPVAVEAPPIPPLASISTVSAPRIRKRPVISTTYTT
jgi:ribA/ribD-fused uncharacterized protein